MAGKDKIVFFFFVFWTLTYKVKIYYFPSYLLFIRCFYFLSIDAK